MNSAGMAIGGGIFRYEAILDGDFFVEMQPDINNDYWFSVANFADNWTWALAGAGPTVGDEHWQATRSVGSTPCLDGGPHCGAWVSLPGIDFAFRIGVDVPEPASIALLGAGLAALGAGALRRRS